MKSYICLILFVLCVRTYVCVILKPPSHHLRLLDVIPAAYDNHRPLYVHMCVRAGRRKSESVGGSSSGSQRHTKQTHSLQSLQGSTTENACSITPPFLFHSHSQTRWWSRARTRVSAIKRMAATLEPRWNVVLVTTATGPTRATATGTTTTMVQGLWPPAPSCWSRPCWPSDSCELFHSSLLSNDSSTFPIC